MKTVPAIKAALLLTLGIVIGDQLPQLNCLILVGTGILTVLVGLVSWRSSWGNLPALGSIILLGILLSNFSHPHQNLGPDIWGKPLCISGKVISQPYGRADRFVSVLRPAWISTAGQTKRRCDGNLRLISASDPRLTEGCQVNLIGEVHPYPERRNPGGRNWREEFARQGIMGWVKPDVLKVLQSGAPSLPHRARSIISKIIHDALAPRQADLLAGMVLGDKSVIPEDMNDDFKRSGLYHLLVVSGSNIGYLMATLTLLVSAFSLNLRLRRLMLLAGIWAYVSITGFSSPTVRAALMISLLLLSFELQRVPQGWNLWGAAAFLILLFAPQQLFQPGFQLSFAALAGVLFAADIRRRQELVRPPLPFRSRRIVRSWDRHIALPFLASLGAVAFTAPILIYNFGGFAPAAILMNLLAIPLAGAIFGLTWIFVLLKVALGMSITALNSGLEVGLKGLEFLASVGSALPGNAAGYYGGFGIAIALLVALMGFFMIKAWRRRTLWMGALLAALLLIISWDSPSYLQIEFLDVGQGDATLLRFPDGKNLLVDCGDENAAKFELVPSLRRRGIHRLQTLLVTHGDKDHAAGAFEMMKSLRVDRLLVNSLEPEDELGRSIINAAGERKIPVQAIALGDTMAGFPCARCVVLWPPQALHGADNAESIVLRVTYGSSDILLAGDIGLREERALLAAGDYLQSEVLKVPHHGSAKSSSRAFLGRVRPQIALISCGARNPYGHPGARVLKDLQDVGSAIHRSDQNGAAILRSDGERIWPVDWR